MQNILIIGAGKLGLPLAYRLYEQGYCVTTVSISPKDVTDTQGGIRHISADVFDLPHELSCQAYDWVYVILTPRQRTLLGYQQAYVGSVGALACALDLSKIGRLVYVSSTQVYGQNHGQAVDDDTKPDPTSDFGKILYAAELLWQAHLGDRLTIIRPSGIVDETRTFLMTAAQNLTHIDAQHWLNLIHHQDVVNILASLPKYEQALKARKQNLKASYILTQTAVMRHQLLNAIRQSMNQPIIAAQDDLPVTGKKLHAKHLQDLLTQQAIHLTQLLNERQCS